jgi:hypothetical protein
MMTGLRLLGPPAGGWAPPAEDPGHGFAEAPRRQSREPATLVQEPWPGGALADRGGDSEGRGKVPLARREGAMQYSHTRRHAPGGLGMPLGAGPRGPGAAVGLAGPPSPDICPGPEPGSY